MKPIPVPIPLDLAEALGVHPSNLSHTNAGRRRLPIDKCIHLMKIAETDERLTGLCFVHLRPELKRALPWLCKGKGRR
jgi:DNA-binding transcriptional regulator YdaS (Cro superfamily)